MNDRDERSPVGTPADEAPTEGEASPSLWDRVRARFAVDTRSLAAVRIGLGLILIADLIHRAQDLSLYYTDEGVYPVAAYAANKYAGLSLHGLSGEVWLQVLLFVLAGLFAVAFVVGYRTRVAGVASLILLLSLQARNPAVLNGGDLLLRTLLFVALVTPLGERWSIDALRAGSPRSTVTSFGTAALLVQPLAVFTTNVIEKSRGETWFAGDALGIALQNEVMTVHLGSVVANHPDILTVLNYGWVTLLAGSIVFLLIPTGRLRSLAALAYIGAFAGMLVTLSVGWFPFVLTVAVVPYLTAPFWDALHRWTPAVPVSALRDRVSKLWSKPPIEQRLLQRLRAAGHRRARSFLVDGASALPSVLGALVLVWILTFSAAATSGVGVPDEVNHAFIDTQGWGLYAPDPTDTYGWYVVEAETVDGRTFDALDGGPVDFDPPDDVSTVYDSFRERKFMESVRASGRDDPGVLAKSYADWACEQAQEHDERTIQTVTVHRVFRKFLVDDAGEDPRRYVVVEHACQR